MLHLTPVLLQIRVHSRNRAFVNVPDHQVYCIKYSCNTLVNMDPDVNWLSPADWKWAQDHLPIACADVVPVTTADDGRTIQQVGLILRNTPHEGKRWCIVGGRMWRNESLADAAGRQLRETLGPNVKFKIDLDRQPDFVIQYFTTSRPIGLVDPRQHAITLAIVVPITGVMVPMGEALEFKWFDPSALPPAEQWGFGQDYAAAQCIERWSKRNANSA